MPVLDMNASPQWLHFTSRAVVVVMALSRFRVLPSRMTDAEFDQLLHEVICEMNSRIPTTIAEVLIAELLPMPAAPSESLPPFEDLLASHRRSRTRDICHNGRECSHLPRHPE